MFKLIKISLIEDAIDNPRAELSELKGLSASIKAHGIIEPCIVTAVPDHDDGPGRYSMLDGHRRKAAALMAGLDEIPCVIRDDEDQVLIALITDGQKVKLTPLEWALAIGYKLSTQNIKGAELARQLGEPVAKISKAKKIFQAVNEDNADRASEFGDVDKLYTWALNQGGKEGGRPKIKLSEQSFESMKQSGYKISATQDGGYRMSLAFNTPDELQTTLKQALAKLDALSKGVAAEAA